MMKWLLLLLLVAASALDIKYEKSIGCPKKPCYEYYKNTIKQFLQRR